MKKLFDLQLFAEDAGANAAASGEGEAAANAETAANDKKYNDDEVNEIIKKKKAEWKKEQDKKIKEAEKLASMNAQEKAEFERDELQKKLAAYEKKEALAEMSKVARKMLQDENVNVGDDVLAHLVSEDAEETKNIIKDFTKAFNSAVEKAVNEKLKGHSPVKGTSVNGSMTKEQILAIQDTELRQKKMLENRHLFNI